jgi:trans-2,3-dihydro-3-hydroxyanthranilate isomerase
MTSSTGSREIPYSIVDVFTVTPFLGNPLAVIKDATTLSDDEMLNIAREFGFAETTFILPPSEDSSTDARVRIFMPSKEVPFAGHPNIGSAYVLATETTVTGKPYASKNNNNNDDELGGAVQVELMNQGYYYK